VIRDRLAHITFVGHPFGGGLVVLAMVTAGAEKLDVPDSIATTPRKRNYVVSVVESFDALGASGAYVSLFSSQVTYLLSSKPSLGIQKTGAAGLLISDDNLVVSLVIRPLFSPKFFGMLVPIFFPPFRQAPCVLLVVSPQICPLFVDVFLIVLSLL